MSSVNIRPLAKPRIIWDNYGASQEPRPRNWRSAAGAQRHRFDYTERGV